MVAKSLSNTINETNIKIITISLILGLLFNTIANAAVAPSTIKHSAPNVILITVDDMGFNTATSFGGMVKGLTPNYDQSGV